MRRADFGLADLSLMFLVLGFLGGTYGAKHFHLGTLPLAVTAFLVVEMAGAVIQKFLVARGVDDFMPGIGQPLSKT